MSKIKQNLKYGFLQMVSLAFFVFPLQQQKRSGMRRLSTVILMLFLLLSVWSADYDQAYAWVEGKILAAIPASSETIEILNESGVDIENIYAGQIRIWATEEELDILTELGIPYTILHDEMQAERDFYEQWKSRRKLMPQIGVEQLGVDYHSYSDMETALRSLADRYPSICRLVDVGDSVQKRQIWAVVISDNVNIEENEPEVRLEGGIHGDEWSSTEVPIDIATYLCKNYQPGSTNIATYIVKNLETWIIPMRNPDGHEKNTRYNANRIDLNRNLDGPQGCSKGRPGCFSEPETKGIRNMFEVMGKRFCLGISYHSGIQLFNSVWNYDCIKPPDEDLFWSNRTTCDNNSGIFDEIPAPNGLADAYNTSHLPTEWSWTNGAEWKVIRGDVTDYAYFEWGMIDTIIECTTPKTPAVSDIRSFLKWHRIPSLKYLKKAIQGIHGVVTDQKTGQPLNATIEIQGKSIQTFTDPEVGDYHRVLMPGTYTLVASAAGYKTQTITGIRVNRNRKTVRDIRLKRTGYQKMPI
jgi:hypothetical protein